AKTDRQPDPLRSDLDQAGKAAGNHARMTRRRVGYARAELYARGVECACCERDKHIAPHQLRIQQPGVVESQLLALFHQLHSLWQGTIAENHEAIRDGSHLDNSSPLTFDRMSLSTKFGSCAGSHFPARAVLAVKTIDLFHIERQPIFLKFANKIPAYLRLFIIVGDFVQYWRLIFKQIRTD